MGTARSDRLSSCRRWSGRFVAALETNRPRKRHGDCIPRRLHGRPDRQRPPERAPERRDNDLESWAARSAMTTSGDDGACGSSGPFGTYVAGRGSMVDAAGVVVDAGATIKVSGDFGIVAIVSMPSAVVRGGAQTDRRSVWVVSGRTG